MDTSTSGAASTGMSSPASDILTRHLNCWVLYNRSTHFFQRIQWVQLLMSSSAFVDVRKIKFGGRDHYIIKFNLRFGMIPGTPTLGPTRADFVSAIMVSNNITYRSSQLTETIQSLVYLNSHESSERISR